MSEVLRYSWRAAIPAESGAAGAGDAYRTAGKFAGTVLFSRAYYLFDDDGSRWYIVDSTLPPPLGTRSTEFRGGYLLNRIVSHEFMYFASYERGGMRRRL